MNTAMRWSVLVIMMICASGCLARCRLPPYAIVGQPILIQFHISSDPKEDKRDVHIWKVADGEPICEARKKEESVLEYKFNVTTKSMDFYTSEGYRYHGIDKEHFLTLSIEKVGPQHEGNYLVEYLKDSYICHLKVLAAPPSASAPDTSTDGVKDSGAADERFFTMHEQDRNAWMQVIQYLIAVVIVAVIASPLSVIFFCYLYFRKMPTASKKKTGEEETSQDDSRGQDQTVGNTSGMSFGYFNVQRRGNMILHTPGSRGARLSDPTGVTEGSAGRGACGMQPDPLSEDTTIDLKHLDPASPMLHGKTRGQRAAPRTRQS